ncbi:hypothetical protein ACFL21_01800 [Patescibacteria group bacterium]
MKKQIKKLAIFLIINTILNILITGTFIAEATDTEASADTAKTEEEGGGPEAKTSPSELAAALDDLEECVPLPSDKEYNTEDYNSLLKKYPALGYIITVIEEPLEAENRGDEKNGDDIVSKICYRNIFFYFETYESGQKIEQVLSEPALATDCSKDAAALAADPSMQEYSPSFRCKKVQVFLTKGGTTTIQAYIGTIYRWGASMAGLISVVVIILNGIRISAAGGDTQAIENAKTRILQSIGGLVLLFLSGLLLYTINPNFFVK